jgi:type VI secretion system ImpM family protein
MTRIVSPAGHASAIGKHVGEPEYLRADTDALASFDAWLNESFEEAFERWGGAWRATFREGASHAFLWWPPGAESQAGPFCGVLAPSRDSVGRDYPFAVAAQIPAKVISYAPHAVPLAVGTFLEGAENVVDAARSGSLSRHELAMKLRSIAMPREEDLLRARDVYAYWCDKTRAAHAWAEVVGDASLPEDIVKESVARKEEALPLRFPLGRAGQRAAALWLDVRGRTTGTAMHSAFWSIDDRVLFAARGSPPSTLVGAIWASGRGADAADRTASPALPGNGTVDGGAGEGMSSFLERLGPRPTLTAP